MPNPLKPSFRTEWYAVAINLLLLVAALFFYSRLPAKTPIHWDWSGRADSYSSPAMAAWFLPILSIALYLLLLFLPKFDPKRDQYQSFSRNYHYFKDLLVSLLFVVYILSNLAALGYQINLAVYIPLIIGGFIAIIGLFLHNLKPNWFIGIRTPWTLSSERVWLKTHLLARPIFIISGLLIATSGFLPLFWKQLVFFLAIAILVFPLPVYSYILYRQERK